MSDRRIEVYTFIYNLLLYTLFIHIYCEQLEIIRTVAAQEQSLQPSSLTVIL